MYEFILLPKRKILLSSVPPAQALARVRFLDSKEYTKEDASNAKEVRASQIEAR